MRPNYIAVCNVKLSEPVDNYFYCVLLSDMYLISLDARERGDNVVFGLDEAMTHTPSTKTGGVEVTELENIVALARKFGITVIILLQYSRRAPTIFRDEYHAFFDIYSYEEMFVDVKLKQRPESAGMEFTEFVSYRPDTNLPFDTHATASFRFDFQVKEALDFLAMYEKDDMYSQIEGLRNYLHYVQGKMALENMPKEFKKYYAWKMYQEKGKKINLSVIAKTLNISTSTAQVWIKEIEEKSRKSEKIYIDQ